MPYGPENCQLTSSFFVSAQTVVSLLQTTQIISHVCFITDHVAYASSNKTKTVWIEMELFLFFTRGGCASCLRACFGARLLPQSYRYPNLSKGADRVGGQLRGDKECSFSGVTKSGRVWRKVPESCARSVIRTSADSCAEIKIEGVTNSLRVRMKVAESDARSVHVPRQLTTKEEGGGGGGCRKGIGNCYERL